MDSISTAFEKFNQSFLSGQPELKASRESYFQNFQKLGWPTRKLESWKYTSLKALTEKNFQPWMWNVDAATTMAIPEALGLTVQSFKDLGFEVLAFFNGCKVEKLSWSLADAEKEGLEIKSVFEDVQLSKQVEASATTYLQQAFAGKKLKLTLKKNKELKKPLVLFNYVDFGSGSAGMFQPSVELILEENSRMNFVSAWMGADQATYFVQPLQKIQLHKKAILNFIDHQKMGSRSFYLGQQSFELNHESELKTLSYQSGALLARNQMTAEIHGHHSNSQFLGLSVLGQSQHADQKTKIQFIDGESTSDQLYKSILAGESKSVFSGLIKINPKAQKSYSTQLNKNLLLSDKASCDSEPQLEIEADDVKANHGSTVGQLSAEELFYLMSRALSKEQSLQMLSLGFAADVMHKFENVALKNYLLQQLQFDFKRIETAAPKAKSL